MLKIKRILSKFRHCAQLSESSALDPVTDPGPSAPSVNGGLPKTRGALADLASMPPAEDSPAKPYHSHQPNSPLEDLHPEVRRLILSMLDLEDLSALVHASPVFYQQYLLDRRSLLCKCLDTTLGSVAVDACAAYRSGLAEFSNSRTNGTVSQFLESYEDRRSSTQYSLLTETLTEDEVVGMAAFHSSIIKPLAQCYARWALANLGKETRELQSHEPLTRTEERRLMRGLYRFQLCCNLFGVGRYEGGSWRLGMNFQAIDILKTFFCLFEPWEVEEIACIYNFSKEKFDQIFSEIRWDVHEENPKFDGQRPPTPEGAFDLDNTYNRNILLKGTISRGLELLHTVFFTIRDHAHLVSTMQEHISVLGGNFLEDEALGETAQWQRRQERLSERDLKQQRRDALPFKGEGERGTDGPYPPLAWTLMWHATYSNLYGYYVLDNIRRWGYVMWDAARFERMGAKEVLARQWGADLGGC